MTAKVLRGALAALAIGAAAAFSGATAAESAKPCTDMSRACVIEVSRTYIEARADNAARPRQRIAPNVKRWENGIVTADKAADLLAGSGTGPIPTLRVRDSDRVLVDGDQAVFFWLLDRKDKADGPFTATVHLIERFKLVQGKAACGEALSPCISEIEVVFCVAPHAEQAALPNAPKDPKWFGKFLCNREG